MFSTKLFTILALAGLAAAVPLEERALPSGHPDIDNSFLSKYEAITEGYVVETGIYPSGFKIPTQSITALPAGYTVAWDNVHDSEGKKVTEFPEDALAAVALKSSSTSNPGAPPASSDSAPPPTETQNAPNAAGALKPSVAGLAAIGLGFALFM